MIMIMIVRVLVYQRSPTTASFNSLLGLPVVRPEVSTRKAATAHDQRRFGPARSAQLLKRADAVTQTARSAAAAAQRGALIARRAGRRCPLQRSSALGQLVGNVAHGGCAVGQVAAAAAATCGDGRRAHRRGFLRVVARTAVPVVLVLRFAEACEWEMELVLFF